MLTVSEALDCVCRAARPLGSRRTPLSELPGLRLAEDVVSGVDSPPFDKSVVDGFAVDTHDAAPTLRVVELVTAGSVPTMAVEAGTTVRVMTGAPLPAGADAVVKWEDCQQLDETTIRNPAGGVPSGACVLSRGASFRAGQAVLERGRRVTAVDIALLAEIGQADAAAFPRPIVGVLATGDELVEAHEPLGPGQIRNSNGPMLRAALIASGATPLDLGVARDDLADLRAKIARGLDECHVLLVSGGVSAGVKDLAPQVFAELAVEELFHQVRVKPGKPLWFGVRSPASAAGEAPPPRGATPTLVFGLPGNPVSTFVSFKLFVEPALAALAGGACSAPATRGAVLAAPLRHRGGRPTYQPCKCVDPGQAGAAPSVAPLDWKGSADMATLARADCLAALPAGDYELASGAAVEVLPL